MYKFVEIDFEFYNPADPLMDLVCCSLRTIDKKGAGEFEEYWIHKGKNGFLVSRLLELKDRIFIAHNVVAEARSFLSLNDERVHPLQFNWICTFAEWRGITNHNAHLRYGKHYLKKGKGDEYEAKTLIPPKWDKFNDKESKQKLKHGLIEMVYKLEGVKLDGERKNRMRDIIISGDEDLIEEHKEEIKEYCTSDIPYLYSCLAKILKEHKRLLGPEFDKESVIKDMLTRGETMVRTAMLEHEGYPINYEATRNFSNQTDLILKDIQRDINRQFPEMGVFVIDKKTRHYVRKEKPIKEWIDSLPIADKWERTKTGNYSLSKDAFSKHFNYRHSYPRDNFGAQMLRFLKTKESLNGFMPSRDPKKRTFWDSVGSDGRVRANINPYGSQSGRYQPSATGYIFLKAAWMRSLVQPEEGKCIIGIDYKSQEYLIAALMSQDEKMIEAYRSGDVYMAYAIESNIAPKGATKKSHPEERDMSKPVVLGISYDMTKYGLSAELSEKTRREVSEKEAQRYIDLFYANYYRYAQYKVQAAKQYRYSGKVRIADGWTMWGDNPNERSAGNCPVQGLGGAILRKAIELCQDAGLKVVAPLHDALYIEEDIDEMGEAAEVFAQCMIQAFDFYLPESGVRLDGEIWSPELTPGEVKTESCDFKVEKIHVDERAGDEYERFKKYFSTPGAELL